MRVEFYSIGACWNWDGRLWRGGKVGGLGADTYSYGSARLTGKADDTLLEEWQ